MNSDSDVDPRVLRRAKNAERQRKRRANCMMVESADQRRARIEIESAQRAAARQDPAVREWESAQRAAARQDSVVREWESVQRAAARQDPVVRERELAQRAARQDPVIRERESVQRAAARARILHHYLGGIDIDETGAAQRQEATDWAQTWTNLDRFVGYTGEEGCH